MYRAACLLFLVCFAAVPVLASADSVSLVASKDNSLFANNENNSDGGGAGIFVGTTNSNQSDALRRGLVQFDVASVVPAGATITDVNLTLYLGQASGSSGQQQIDLHRLTVDWGEGTAGNSSPSISGTGTGFPANAGDATWTQRYYQQQNWSAAGAEGDYVPTISGNTLVGTALDSPYTWPSTPAMVSDVQGWLNHPSTNYGWIMIEHVENVPQTVKAFYSRDAMEKNNVNGDPLPAEWRPTLEITYTLGATGDYNGNSFVDSGDYVVWRKTLNDLVSPPGSGADGNQSGAVDSGDYICWRTHFDNTLGEGASTITRSIAEPLSARLALPASLLVLLRRRR